MFTRSPVICMQKLTIFRKAQSGIAAISRAKTTSTAEDRIVITDDGSTVVCWHPSKQFPYECSRPIPEDEVKPQNTILKVENKSQIYGAFKSQSEEAAREELMKLTHTTKHRWFPNSLRHKKLYKKIKGDREFL